MPPQPPPPPRRTTTVRGHARTTQTGRVVKVRRHSRTLSAWKQAGIAWAGTAASGLTTLALLIDVGFNLLSVLLLLITVGLGLVSAQLTAKATKPQRTMRAQTRRPAPRRTTPPPRPTPRPRRRL